MAGPRTSNGNDGGSGGSSFPSLSKLKFGRRDQNNSNSNSNNNKNRGSSSNNQHRSNNNHQQQQEGEFSARRSGRVSANRYAADGDTWFENLAVVEMPIAGQDKKLKNASASSNKDYSKVKYELVIRSYFQSQTSGHRVWDEPPSGASSIQFASEEAKNMAKIQLRDLQVTTSTVAVSQKPENNQNSHPSDGKGSRFGKLKKLIGKSKDNNDNDDEAMRESVVLEERRKICYKKGSLTAKGFFDEDRDLQAALAMSIAANNESNQDDNDLSRSSSTRNNKSNRGRSSRNSNANTNTNSCLEEQEAIAMAQAMSLSEAETQQNSANSSIASNSQSNHRSHSYRSSSSASTSTSQWTQQQRDEEERMLQRVLEESKMQTVMEEDPLPSHQSSSNYFSDDDDNPKNKKMPAREMERNQSSNSRRNHKNPLDSVDSFRSVQRSESNFRAYGVACASSNQGGDEDVSYISKNMMSSAQSQTSRQSSKYYNDDINTEYDNGSAHHSYENRTLYSDETTAYNDLETVGKSCHNDDFDENTAYNDLDTVGKSYYDNEGIDDNTLYNDLDTVGKSYHENNNVGIDHGMSNNMSSTYQDNFVDNGNNSTKSKSYVLSSSNRHSSTSSRSCGSFSRQCSNKSGSYIDDDYASTAKSRTTTSSSRSSRNS